MIKLVASGRWGKLIADDRIEDCGKARIAREFLESILARMSKRSFDFWKRYDREDYPLRYDERRMTSLVSAAVDQITPCHLTELPINRMPGKRPRSGAEEAWSEPRGGRIDLWCYYRKNDIVVELKQLSISPAYTGERSRLVEIWKKLDNQIISIEKDLKEWSDSYLRIGLLTVLAIQTKREGGRFSERGATELLSDVRETVEVARHVPWCAAWTPPGGPITLEYENDEGNLRVERVPTVLFLARIPRARDGTSYA